MIERCEPITNIFDTIHYYWSLKKVQRARALFIFIAYIVSLAVIEANREGFIPAPLSLILPTSHFQAIQLALTLILGLGTIELILSITLSLSRALGKQFEIMALILLRSAFRELANLPEPVALVNGPMPLIHIAVSGTGALVIFICLGFYNRLRVHQNFITIPGDQMRYVMAKKLLALFLLCLVTGIAMRDLWLTSSGVQEVYFFETIYTMLIFADVALVLISQRYMPTFPAVFRNTAFVISTLMMRLSLSVSFPWGVATSVFAAFYILGLTAAIRYFGSSKQFPQA